MTTQRRAPAVADGVRTRHHVREEVMGTVVTIDLYDASGIDERALAAHVAAALAGLHEADRVFSTWIPDSPLSRIRRGELTVPLAPREVADVLAGCMVARSASGGWFDPWAMPGGVDPTGYVKGWAAQRALDVLASSGVDGAMVNAAGDIASAGSVAPGTAFRVGIADPTAPRELACVIELHGAVATSGTYERGAHLVDPRTRRAASRVASASVTGPDLAMADALATGLAIGGDDVLRRIERLDGYDALTIGFDGAQSWTPTFPFADPRP